MNRYWLACCLLTATTGYAQKEKINTDRPDQTEGTNIIQPGALQGEFGLMYVPFDRGESAVIGRGMLRYGLLKQLELRLLAEDGRERDRYMEEATQSNYPLAAGAKVSLVKDHSFLPDISLVAYVKLPFTSRSSDQSAYWSPTVIAAFKNKLSDKWEVDYNAGYKQAPYSADHVWLGTISVQYWLTLKTEVFAEYFADYASGENPQHNADAGLIYVLSNDCQIDLSAGTSLASGPGNRFISFGFGLRMPGTAATGKTAGDE